MNISRGDIFLASLDPVIGHEISKTRPVVIVSNNVNNKYNSTVSVLPLTSQKVNKVYPFEVLIEEGEANLQKRSKIKADQIRTLDKIRLIKRFGCLSEVQIKELNKSIKIHLALD
jgi:mRNA interferase MazF